jgi:hypothetical protein
MYRLVDVGSLRVTYLPRKLAEVDGFYSGRVLSKRLEAGTSRLSDPSKKLKPQK